MPFLSFLSLPPLSFFFFLSFKLFLLDFFLLQLLDLRIGGNTNSKGPQANCIAMFSASNSSTHSICQDSLNSHHHPHNLNLLDCPQAKFKYATSHSKATIPKSLWLLLYYIIWVVQKRCFKIHLLVTMSHLNMLGSLVVALTSFLTTHPYHSLKAKELYSSPSSAVSGKDPAEPSDFTEAAPDCPPMPGI